MYTKIGGNKMVATTARTNRLIAAGVAIAVAIVGYTLYLGFAAGPFLGIETEAGTLASGATIGNDPNASGGKYVALTSTTIASGSNQRFPGDPNPLVTGRAFFGASGENISSYESSAGKSVGLFRKFYTPTQWGTSNASSLANLIKTNYAANRIVWASFKTPKWAEMAAGTHDATLDQMLKTIDAAGHPLWLTFHHEPENDEGGSNAGSAADYVAMQKHIRARMTALGTKNIAFAPVYMCYWIDKDGAQHDRWWPGSGVWDFTGFDCYQSAAGVDLLGTKWQNAIKWIEAKGLPYAVAEYGLKENNPTMLRDFWAWQFGTTKRDRVGISYWDTAENALNLSDRTGNLATFIDILKNDSRAMRPSELVSGGSSTTTNAVVTTSVSVPTAGAYKVWSRIMGPDATNNSYTLQIDSTAPQMVGDGSIPANTWTWVALPNTVNLTQGAHTIKMTNREAGTRVDSLLLLSDTSCTPTGTGGNCTSTTDTTAPTVSITAPTASSTVSGVVPVAVSATDNIGTTKIELYIDNTLKGTDTSSPFSFEWDSKTVANGSHALSLKAYDAAGNLGNSGASSVTVNNASTSPSGTCTVSSTHVNSCRPWLSAAVGGYSMTSGAAGTVGQFSFYNKRLNNPNVLTDPSLSTTLTHKIDTPHVYHQQGENLLQGTTLDIINTPSLVSSTDAPILINYKPGSGTWAQTAAGSYDAGIIASAKAIKAVAPKRVILAIYHEPENSELNSQGLTITDGCSTPNGNMGSAADFRAMFRHTVEVFRAQGVTNVAYGINYMGYVGSGSSGWACTVLPLWPGNDVVDWVLWDPYAKGEDSTFGNSINRFYKFLTDHSDADHNFTSKAWGVGEHGSNRGLADMTDYYNEGVAAIGTNWTNNQFPRIKLWSVFDTSNNGGENGGLRVGYNDLGQVSVGEQTEYNKLAKAILSFNGGSTTADTTAPSTPTNLSSSAQTTGSVSLSWTASTDNKAVSAYKVYRNGVQVAATASTTYTDNGLTASTTYSYRVAAVDAAGNVSPQSTALSVTTKAAPDVTDPTAPANLTTSNLTSSSVGLRWTASTDNVGVASYLVQRNGVTIARPTATSYTDQTLVAGTAYAYRVLATDAAGNTSPASNTASVTAPQPPDTTAPSVPTGLTGAPVSQTQINLSWTASTDNVGVASYQVFRGGAQIGTTQTTSFGDTGLSANTAYQYAIKAVDSAGNASALSTAVKVTTLSTSPTTSGTGLWAEYFTNTDLTGAPATAKQEQQVNYNWGSGTPAYGVGADNFSARWSGRITASTSGTYTFYAKADDGVRLWVNDQLVVDEWTTHGAKEFSGSRYLTAGVSYNIRLEYFEKTGKAVASLSWSGPNTKKQVIPSTVLSPQQYGLTASYYDSTDLTGLVSSKLSKTLDHNWEDREPLAGIGSDNFSVRWSGRLVAPITGTYVLITDTDDGVRLSLGGRVLIDDWQEHGVTANTATVSLIGGQSYPIIVEYYEAKGLSEARLSWTGPGIEKQVIPSTNLRNR